MPERIIVRNPEFNEELRQLAEVIADIHYVIGIIVEERKELVPGEAQEELNDAWAESQVSLVALIDNLAPRDSEIKSRNKSIYRMEDMQKAQLIGATGKFKRT